MDALSAYLALENSSLTRRMEEMERNHNVAEGELLGQIYQYRASLFLLRDQFLNMQLHAQYLERRLTRIRVTHRRIPANLSPYVPRRLDFTDVLNATDSESDNEQ